MSPRRKRLLAFVSVLVLLAVSVRAVVNSEAFERWFTGAVQLGMEQALNEEVVLGRAELELWPPRATLHGVVVKGEDGPIATLERGRAHLGMGRLRLLELDEPELRLHIDDGQLREFQGLESSGDDELPYDQLIVRGGDFTVHTGDTVLEVQELDLRPSLDGEHVDLSVGALAVVHGDRRQVAEGLLIEGITLRKDRVVVPAFRADFPAVVAEGQAAVIFGGDVGAELALEFDSEELSTLLPVDVLGPLTMDVELSGTVDDPVVGLTLWAEPTLVVGDYDYVLGRMTGWATVDDSGLVVHQLGGVWGDGFSHLEGRLDWEGRVHDAHLVLEDVSLAEALIATGPWTEPWVDFRGDLEYHPQGQLDPFALQGPIQLAFVDLEVAGGPPARSVVHQRVGAGVLEGSLTFDADEARIQADTLVFDRSRGSGVAVLPFEGDPVIDVDLDRADLRSLKPLGGAQLQGLGRLQLRIAGPYDDLKAGGKVEVRDFGMLGWRMADVLVTPVRTDDWRTISFPGFEARVGETRLHGDLDLVFAEELRLDLVALTSGQLEDLGGIFVPLDGVSAPMEGTISLRGPLERLDGEVELALSQVSLYGETFPTGRVDSRMEEGLFVLDGMTVERPQGRLRARGSVGAGWAMSMDVEAEGFELATMDTFAAVDRSLAGELRGAGRVAGTLMEPEPEGTLTLRRGKLRGEALPALTAEFGTEGRRLTGVVGSADGSVQGTGSVALTEDAAWEADALVRRFPAHIFWPVAADGRPVTALLDGELQAEGAGGVGTVEASGQRASVSWGGYTLASSPFSVGWGSDGWRVDDLRLVGEGTSLDVGVAARTGRLQVDVVGSMDAAWLPALTDTIDQAAGPLEVDLRLDGPTSELDGALRLGLKGVDLRSPAFPHPLQDLRGEVLGSPKGYRLPESLLGRMGGGDVVLTGFVDAEKWSPTRYELKAKVDGARVDLVEDLPPMVGDATLTLSGPADDLLLSGEVTVEDMLFAERIDWEQWTVDWRARHLDQLVDAPTEREPLFALDVQVTANGTARVRNNVGDGRLDADLRIVGDDTRIGMVGEVRMQEGGRAFLHDREFEVTRGELRYVDPYSYDPIVDFVLETDVRGDDRTYRITYPISGPFSQLETNPSSDPPLPQVDINSLLLFGVTTENLERTGGAGAAMALQGAGLLFAGETSRALDRFGGDTLDVFQYTRVDLVTGVSQRGALTSTEWRLLVEQNLDEPIDVTLVGEFGLDDTYLAAERELYDNLYLNVYWSSEQRQSSRNIGGAYGADFKVRWESE